MTTIQLTTGEQVTLYPFPMSNGQIATLQLPANEPLMASDAERLAAFLLTLVVDRCDVCGDPFGDEDMAGGRCITCGHSIS